MLGNTRTGVFSFLFIFGLIIGGCMIFPIIYLGSVASEIGWEFLEFIISYKTLSILINSILLAVSVTTLSILIGVPAAFLTVRTDLYARKFWTIALALPLSIPSFVGSLAIIATLAPRGSIIQNLLAPLGIDKLPSIYGWPGTILALTLFTYPYILLTTRAGLRGMDPALEETARTLGLSIRSVIRRVTIPYTYPSIAAGGLLVSFYTLSDFGTPSLMRFNSLTRVIYIEYLSAYDRSGASILSFFLVLVIMAVLYIEYRSRSKSKYYNTGLGSSRRLPIVELGPWKWPAQIFCVTIISFGLIIPLGVMIYWFIRGISSGESFPIIGELIFNTVFISGLATLVVVSSSLAVALLIVKFPNKLSVVLERLIYLGFAMPGIVIALSLVSFGSRYVPGLYQSLGMLVFAYTILFLPLGVGTIRSSLLVINPRLEEAASSLGLGQGKIIQKVTIPLIRSGLVASSALVMLTTMKELPATLLLSPIGFRTLATQVWSDTEAAFFFKACVSGLVLVIISTLILTIILHHEKKNEQGVWV